MSRTPRIATPPTLDELNAKEREGIALAEQKLSTEVGRARAEELLSEVERTRVDKRSRSKQSPLPAWVESARPDLPVDFSPFRKFIRPTPLETLQALLLQTDLKFESYANGADRSELDMKGTAHLFRSALKAYRLEQADPALLAKLKVIKEAHAKVEAEFDELKAQLPLELRSRY